jgi:hypothetical protein
VGRLGFGEQWRRGSIDDLPKRGGVRYSLLIGAEKRRPTVTGGRLGTRSTTAASSV